MHPLPSTSEAALAEVIRKLGEAEFETALWHLLQRVATPDNLVILFYRQAGPTEVLYSQSTEPQVFAALRGLYVQGAYLLDPYYDLHLRRVPPGLYRLRDVAPDAFQRSRYYIDYYVHTTLVDELTFIAYPAAGVSMNICIGKDRSSGHSFTARQIETCQAIAPIVIALAERHWANLPQVTKPAEDLIETLVQAVQTTHAIRLSRRQAEVAILVLRGHSSVSASLRLGVSVQTIKVFRKQLYARCRISSQAELFAMMLPLLKVAG